MTFVVGKNEYTDTNITIFLCPDTDYRTREPTLKNIDRCIEYRCRLKIPITGRYRSTQLHAWQHGYMLVSAGYSTNFRVTFN
jgi:hypothetical protein